jgi:uncharacterized protein YggU (UPF0235/DUF167 family)
MAGELDAFLISLHADAGGVLLPVRAQPRARREGRWACAPAPCAWGTTAAPEDGRATARIGSMLADTLGVPRSAVLCVVGPQRRDKLFRVAGLTPAQAGSRLREALG